MDEEQKREPVSNIAVGEEIRDVLLKHGITMHHHGYEEPLNKERLKHIFTLVKELIRVY